MKKVLFMISVIIVLLISSLTVFALEGDGTEETPFLVTVQAELELVTDFYDCHFKLANDMVFLNQLWL